MGVALHKVKAPDVVGPLRAETNAGAVVEPQPTAWPMLLGHLEPLATPDALNPVLAHTPACDLQQSGDATVAIAPILRGKGHDGSGECIFVSPHRGHVALGPTGLADQAAGVALREAVLVTDALHGLTASLGAYKFPAATSLSTRFSSERSATSRRRRAFSRSSSFRRLACSSCRPPYSRRQR